MFKVKTKQRPSVGKAKGKTPNGGRVQNNHLPLVDGCRTTEVPPPPCKTGFSKSKDGFSQSEGCKDTRLDLKDSCPLVRLAHDAHREL